MSVCVSVAEIWLFLTWNQVLPGVDLRTLSPLSTRANTVRSKEANMNVTGGVVDL